MKTTTLPLIFTCGLAFFFAIGNCFGQKNRESYTYWRDTALVLYGQGRFEEAISSFRVASVCNDLPPKNDVNLYMDSCYSGYVRLLKSEKERANLAQLKAEQEARANSMAAQALRVKKYNPTHALRIAEAGAMEFPDNDLIRQSLVEIMADKISPFYKKVVSGHEAEVSCVAASPDGSLLASGSWDGTLIIYDNEGVKKRELKSHLGIVTSVAFFHDAPLLVSGSSDNTAIVWDFGGNIIRILSGHKLDVSGVAVSPDDQTIATSSWDGTARTWSFDGKELMSFPHGGGYVSSVAFSPDGGKILTAGWDKNVVLWDLAGNLMLKILAHDSPVTTAIFSPDGQQILTAGWDRAAKLWGLDGQMATLFQGHDATVDALCFSSDGSAIFTGSRDNKIKIWNKSGQLQQTLTGHNQPVKSLFFVEKGSYLISGSSDFNMIIWNTNGVETSRFKAHPSKVNDICYSPDGKYLVSCGQDNSVKIWDENGGLVKEIKTKLEPIVASYSPMGDKFAVGFKGTTKNLTIFDPSGQELYTFSADIGAYVQCIDYSPDGEMLAVGGLQTKAKVFKDTTFLSEVNGHKHHIYAIKFLPDGLSFLTGSRDRRIIHWDLEGNNLKTISAENLGEVNAIVVDREGKSFFATSAHESGISLFHFDLDGNTLHVGTGHTKAMRKLAGHPTQPYLVSTGLDNKAMVWDYACHEKQFFSGLDGGALAISPNGYVTTCDLQGDAKNWVLFSDYLKKGDYLGELTADEKFIYGLSSEKPATSAPTKERTALAEANKAVLLVENMLYNNYSLDNERYLGMYYSAKARQEHTVSSKVFFQAKSVELMEKFKVTAEGRNLKLSAGSRNTLSFSYGCLSLWLLMDNQREKAMEFAEKCKLEAEAGADEEVKEWYQVILALNYLAIDDYDGAVNLMTPIKSKLLSNPNLANLIKQMQVKPPQDGLTYGSFMLDCIDELEAKGIVYKKNKNIKRLLEVKP